jgi:2',3'-cyclic-nucleotide 2'-phosphodiesterase / 3'-nucleotidase
VTATSRHLSITALLCAGFLLHSAAHAQQLRLRVLGTTDLHVHLLGFDYYQDKTSEEFGLARTATLIKAARAEVPNTLLLDNGDLLQGNPLGDTMARIKPLQPGQVHPAYKVMNALKYDAANIGNHEFNYGLPYLQLAIKGAAFPYVNANIVVDSKGAAGQAAAEPVNVFTPYVILDRRFTDSTGAAHTLRIGVIGFVPPQVMQWDRQNLAGRVTAQDIVQTAKHWVPRMRAAGADVVVAVPHSGFERGETVAFAENTVARLAEIPGIDAILFGHSHGEFPGRFFSSHPKVDLARGTINGVPAAMPGAWGSHLAVMDLTLNKTADATGKLTWQVDDARAELRPIYDRTARKALVEPDASISALVQAEHEATRTYLQSQVATSSAPIHSYFAQVADDPSVQLVSQAQLAYGNKLLAGTPHAQLPLLSAAAPFKTGGRQGYTYYTDIPAGPLVVRHVADLYVYPNTVKVVRLTGAQVREWLEMAAGAFNRIDPAGAPEQNLLNTAFPSFNFDTLDGVTYRIDVTQPARYDRSGKVVAPEARRIQDLRHQGQPVQDSQLFAVVTNNYRAAGGGNFPALDGSTTVADAPDENREALMQHLQNAQRNGQQISPSADNNWRINPVPGVKLRFVSGAGGIPHLPLTPQVRLVKDNGDGSALYELAGVSP